MITYDTSVFFIEQSLVCFEHPFQLLLRFNLSLVKFSKLLCQMHYLLLTIYLITVEFIDLISQLNCLLRTVNLIILIFNEVVFLVFLHEVEFIEVNLRSNKRWLSLVFFLSFISSHLTEKLIIFNMK